MKTNFFRQVNYDRSRKGTQTYEFHKSLSNSMATVIGQGMKKRSIGPQIRPVKNPIYDPVNGKSCHQCRQKTTNFVAQCNNKNGNKQCTIKFCFKCLWNRYAEKAEEVTLVSDWRCPKCRGICNCSNCMKKRGQNPTGILAPVAKKSGFSSVSEMLNIGCTENLNKGPVIASPMKKGKENSRICSVNVNDDSTSSAFAKCPQDIYKENPNGNQEDDSNSKRPKISFQENKLTVRDDVFLDFSSDLCKERIDSESQQDSVLPDALDHNDAGVDKVTETKKEHEQSISLPHGADLKTVAGLDIPSESIGPALQFLEFCSAFGKALDLRKGRAESIIREIVQGRDRRRCQYSSTVQFHIQLLELMQEDLAEDCQPLSPSDGKNSWLKALGKCISESDVQMKAIPSAVDAYDKLDLSEKLRLLSFLCDEVLGTIYFREWIDEQNAKFVEIDKESRQKVSAAKEKEKHLRKKLQDEVAATIMSNRDPSEHEAIAAQLRDEMARAHAEMLEAMTKVPTKGERCAAVRTVPLFLDDSGRVFWKLKCSGDVLLQEIGSYEEKWVIYNAEKKLEIEKYISYEKSKSPWNNK